MLIGQTKLLTPLFLVSPLSAIELTPHATESLASRLRAAGRAVTACTPISDKNSDQLALTLPHRALPDAQESPLVTLENDSIAPTILKPIGEAGCPTRGDYNLEDRLTALSWSLVKIDELKVQLGFIFLAVMLIATLQDIVESLITKNATYSYSRQSKKALVIVREHISSHFNSLACLLRKITTSRSRISVPFHLQRSVAFSGSIKAEA